MKCYFIFFCLAVTVQLWSYVKAEYLKFKLGQYCWLKGSFIVSFAVHYWNIRHTILKIKTTISLYSFVSFIKNWIFSFRKISSRVSNNGTYVFVLKIRSEYVYSFGRNPGDYWYCFHHFYYERSPQIYYPRPRFLFLWECYKNRYKARQRERQYWRSFLL